MKSKKIVFIKNTRFLNLFRILKDKFKKQDIPKTKFGGKPDWIEEPQWPISRATNLPMQFLCQVAIDPELFPAAKGKMAYVFIANFVTGKQSPDICNPESGDNAVIIQPHGKIPMIMTNRVKGILTTSPIFASDFTLGNLSQKPIKPTKEYVTVEALTHGPSEMDIIDYKLVDNLESDKNFYESKELNRNCFVSDEAYEHAIDEAYNKFQDRSGGSKIGGQPFFIQEPEYPRDPSVNKLLLQLDGVDFNYGEPVFYVFINTNATKGRLIIQFS